MASPPRLAEDSLWRGGLHLTSPARDLPTGAHLDGRALAGRHSSRATARANCSIPRGEAERRAARPQSKRRAVMASDAPSAHSVPSASRCQLSNELAAAKSTRDSHRAAYWALPVRRAAVDSPSATESKASLP